jgi:stearoyl-CoA 9-desaturase NADPH oxidoreductase
MGLPAAPLRALEALATPHGVDRYLELVHPMLVLGELRASVTDVRRNPHAVTLTLRPNRRWNGFRAGQFTQVAVEIGGVRHTRCYSLANSAHRTDGLLEITVGAHDRGTVSRYLHAEARRGLVVGLSRPEGEFTLPLPRPRRIVFISGGSGITPVLSMLRTLCDEGYTGEIGFLHYAPTPAHVGYRSELRRLAGAYPNVRLAIVHTRTDDGDLAGHFGDDHLTETAPWWTDAETYLCGPGPLMDAVRAHYEHAGVGERLHTEAFTLTPVTRDVGEATGEVSFARSGTSAPNSGAPLLEQAEAAGLTPDYGCRMGICFSCTQLKRSGCTRDVRTGELHTDPDTDIQLCINVPVGDVAIDL